MTSPKLAGSKAQVYVASYFGYDVCTNNVYYRPEIGCIIHGCDAMTKTVNDFAISMKKLVSIASSVADIGEGGEKPNTCIVCGYVWKYSCRSSEPCRCPSCRTTLWNAPVVYRHKCIQCGHRWVGRTLSPERCPSCKSRTWNKPPVSRMRPECHRLKASTPTNAESTDRLFSFDESHEAESDSRCNKKLPEDPWPKVRYIMTQNKPEIDKGLELMKDCGFSDMDAQIILRHGRRESCVAIASALGCSIGRVMGLIRIYDSHVDGEGR